MIAYPVTLTADDNGRFLVTSPDFPELTTFGETIEDAVEHAEGALLEAIEARLHDGELVPRPSAGKHLVALPAQAAIKVRLYQLLQSEGIRKAELARRMKIPRQEVDRILDLNHGTALAKMELAFAVLGKRLTVDVAPSPGRRRRADVSA